MLFIDYRKLNNDNEIKKLNDNKEILYKQILINEKINYFNKINNFYNSIYYDYELNKNELKEKILFNIKLMIMNEKLNNIKDLLNNIYINENENEIYFFNNNMIKKFKINNEKIFNECIKFLNKDNEKLNEYIEIIKKYNETYNKEIELKEKIKKLEIEKNKMKNENYKIKNELRKKFNYELYYY